MGVGQFRSVFNLRYGVAGVFLPDARKVDMAKYAQIEDLEKGEIFRVVEETAGEVYFYDEFHRWCYFNKSEEGKYYRYIPAGVRLTQRAMDKNRPA